MKRYRQAEMLGTISALLIGLFAIGSATYAGVHGAQWTGSIIGTAGVTGLVTAFMAGRSMLNKHLAANKQAANTQNPSTSEITRT
jgi:hypothetical protein